MSFRVTTENLESVQGREINVAKGLGIVLCDKRVKELEMFSLTTKRLRREVSAIFKYLVGRHM